MLESQTLGYAPWNTKRSPGPKRPYQTDGARFLAEHTYTSTSLRMESPNALPRAGCSMATAK